MDLNIETIKQNIRVNLLRIRTGAKKNCNEMATELSIPRERYYSYERAKSVMPLDIMLKVCKRFNVDMKEFLTTQLQ